ncbi:MAG: glucose 1-dehydrogenase [Thermaerobacter sp.]|nr:glucose 1-dehydrogenase [Thermaerobacter sp.]
MDNPFDIAGKRAVVTGGAAGIGFGIVQRLVAARARVLIADLDGAAAQAAVVRSGASPGQAMGIGLDIATEGAPQALLDAAVEHLGAVDILVNNAGIYPSVPMLETTPELFDRVYRVNLRGVAFACQAAARQMIAQGGGGRIINIASIDSLHPSSVGLAAYDASKGGVLMLTKNLALEFAPHGILVNAIAPGGIRTEGTSQVPAGVSAEAYAQLMESFTSRIPLGRWGIPDDIAKVALFLASPAADYLTGSLVVVDGGRLLG